MPDETMRSNLEERYRLLLLSYENGGWDTPPGLKRTLLEHVVNVSARPRLRADAGLCLLVLFDQMILRPYTGYIPSSQNLAGVQIEPPADNLLGFQMTVFGSLQSIFKQLDTVPKSLYSSHDVLQAIEALWPQLSASYGWG
jgi:hypothetical protein